MNTNRAICRAFDALSKYVIGLNFTRSSPAYLTVKLFDRHFYMIMQSDGNIWLSTLLCGRVGRFQIHKKKEDSLSHQLIRRKVFFINFILEKNSTISEKIFIILILQSGGCANCSFIKSITAYSIWLKFLQQIQIKKFYKW